MRYETFIISARDSSHKYTLAPQGVNCRTFLRMSLTSRRSRPGTESCDGLALPVTGSDIRVRMEHWHARHHEASRMIMMFSSFNEPCTCSSRLRPRVCQRSYCLSLLVEPQAERSVARHCYSHGAWHCRQPQQRISYIAEDFILSNRQSHT